MTKTKLIGFTSIVALLGMISVAAYGWFWSKNEPEATGPIVEIEWADLIPADFEQPPNPFETMTREEIDKLLDGSEESNQRIAEFEEIMAYAPTNDELDLKRIKMPGYVVPLEFDGQTELDEFLLVPYYGACIHTPPPPSNQVVHTIASNSVTVDDPYSPVWVIGTLHADTVVSNLAESGYRLELERIEPYDWEN